MSAKIDVIVGTNELVLTGTLAPPYHTGKKNKPSSRNIYVRNSTPSQLRICFQSRDTRPVSVYFKTPINLDPSDDKVGWVELDAPNPGGDRQYTLLLDSKAWPLAPNGDPLGAQLKISAHELAEEEYCSFDESEDSSHVTDIIIDGGI